MNEEERIKKATEAFAKMDKHDKIQVVCIECSKLLIAAMIDSDLENYINCQMMDDKGNAYQLLFVRKPMNDLELK